MAYGARGGSRPHEKTRRSARRRPERMPRRRVRNEAQIGISDLENAVERHQFSDARDAAIFLSIVFDATACREIAHLLDHLPHFAPIIENSENKSQPRWIESIADLDRVSSLLSNLSKE